MRRVFCAATLAACLMTAARSEEPAFAQRPDSTQISAGCTAGRKTSCAPARFISPRMMFEIFWMVRVASGRKS